MLLNILLCFSLICLSTSEITCPSPSWSDYKKIVEGPWSLKIPDNKLAMVNVAVQRNISYRCSSIVGVAFRTTRVQIYSINSKSYLYNFSSGGLGICNQDCNSRNVRVKQFYRDNKWSNWHETWSGWSESRSLGEFIYLNKNCDKLYWTSWTETTTCNSSFVHSYSRYCVDCDEQSLNPKYCMGNTTKQEKYTNLTVGCNKTEERVRKRKCLYGDGSEAPNVRLCSDTGKPPHFGVYIIAIAAFCLIILFCYFFNFFRKRLMLKRNQRQASTEQMQLHIEHHTYEVIQDIAGSTIRNVETFKTFKQNNSLVKISKRSQNNSTKNNNHKIADKSASLKGYETPMNFTNLNNRKDSELNPYYSYAQVKPTTENRNVTENDTKQKPEFSGAIPNVSNVG